MTVAGQVCASQGWFGPRVTVWQLWACMYPRCVSMLRHRGGSQGTENSLVAFEDQKPFDMVVTIKCLLFKY